MAIFSGDRKIEVAGTIFPVFTPDSANTSPITNGILQALASNQDIIPYILQASSTGHIANLRKYWEYGKEKSPIGLPDGRTLQPYSDATEEDLIDVLVQKFPEANKGDFSKATISYSDTPPDVVHSYYGLTNGNYENMAVYQLGKDGYNAFSNTFDIPILQKKHRIFTEIPNTEIADYTIYMKDFEVVSLDPYVWFDLLKAQGREDESDYTNFFLPKFIINVYFIKKHNITEEEVIVEETLIGETPPLFWGSLATEVGAMYSFRLFTQSSESPDRKWYNYDEITAPSVQNQSKVIAHDQFFPLLAIANQGIYYADHKDSDKFGAQSKASYDMGDILGISLKAMSDSIKNSPDGDKVVNAYLTLSADFMSKEKAIVTYLYHHFSKELALGGSVYDASPIEHTIIEDVFIQKTSYSSVKRKFYLGKMPDLTKGAGGPNHRDAAGQIAYIGAVGEIGAIRTLTNPNKDYTGRILPLNGLGRDFYIGRQITEDTWEQLEVEGIYFSTHTVEGKLVQGLPPHLPIRKDYLEELPNDIQEFVARYGAVVTVITAESKHLAFYKGRDFQLFFEAVMMVVQIVILVFTVGGGGGLVNSASQSIGNTIAESIVEGALGKLLGRAIDAGISYLIGKLGEIIAGEIARLIGGDLGEIIGIAVGITFNILASNFLSGNSFDFADGALTWTEIVAEEAIALPEQIVSWAKTSFQAANIGKELYTNTLEDKYTELSKDIRQFEIEREVAQKELDAITEELYKGSVDINAYMLGILDSVSVQIESPSNFYNRTIHTGNPGVLTLYKPSYFVRNALQLPNTITSPLEIDELNLV